MGNPRTDCARLPKPFFKKAGAAASIDIDNLAAFWKIRTAEKLVSLIRAFFGCAPHHWDIAFRTKRDGKLIICRRRKRPFLMRRNEDIGNGAHILLA